MEILNIAWEPGHAYVLVAFPRVAKRSAWLSS